MNPKPTSLRDRAAQLVFARIGSNMPPPATVAEDAARVEAFYPRTRLRRRDGAVSA
ncbi:MAG: hypothetical protein IH820_17430 [Bacteroidetes bacterium]|nr:hypothetical protein [Bacteroidota bacterium]